MTTMSTPIILPSEANRQFVVSGLHTAEIPVEHTESILLPTLRFGFPAYAFFAAPSVRAPGQPLTVGVPDRWVALRADSGRAILYATVDAFPMDGQILERVTLPLDTRTVAEAVAAQDRLTALIDAAAEGFFAGIPLPAGIAEAFAAVVPDALRPAYRALGPDFMAALEHA